MEASPGLGQGPEDPDENTFLCNGSRSLNKKPQDYSRGKAGGRGRTWAGGRGQGQGTTLETWSARARA